MLMWQKLFWAMGHLRHSGVPRIRRSGHKQTKAETCQDMWVKIWTSHAKNCDKSVPTIADGGPNVHPSISTTKIQGHAWPTCPSPLWYASDIQNRFSHHHHHNHPARPNQNFKPPHFKAKIQGHTGPTCLNPLRYASDIQVWTLIQVFLIWWHCQHLVMIIIVIITIMITLFLLLLIIGRVKGVTTPTHRL